MIKKSKKKVVKKAAEVTVDDEPRDVVLVDEKWVRADGSLYARVTRNCKNSRMVIVTPFDKRFPSGRMTIPKKGAGKKLGERNRKFWIKPVEGVFGLYVHAGNAKRYS